MTARIKSKLKTARHAYKLEVRGTLSLPFALRRAGRGAARLESGEEIALELAGEVLRGGDLVVASDGRVLEVRAEAEDLWQVECASPAQVARAAYLLGERHVPVELREGLLRLAVDPALEDLLKPLASRLTRVRAPFEPELGAAPEAHTHADHGHGHHHHEHPHHHPHPHGHDHE